MSRSRASGLLHSAVMSAAIIGLMLAPDAYSSGGAAVAEPPPAPTPETTINSDAFNRLTLGWRNQLVNASKTSTGKLPDNIAALAKLAKMTPNRRNFRTLSAFVGELSDKATFGGFKSDGKGGGQNESDNSLELRRGLSVHMTAIGTLSFGDTFKKHFSENNTRTGDEISACSVFYDNILSAINDGLHATN